MAVELKVPTAGESIAEVYIGEWRKQPGDSVKKGDVLVELETDKATLELPAPLDGTLSEIRAQQGDTVPVGAVIAIIEESGAAGASPAAGATSPATSAATPAAISTPATAPAPREGTDAFVMPAARRLLESSGISPAEVEATGPGGRLLKEDVLRHLETRTPETAGGLAGGAAVGEAGGEDALPTGRRIEVRPLSPIRARIAERLVEAQHTAALLTTFNEVEMTKVIELRTQYGEAFQAKHGVKLGFMSFFVKAAVAALREFPELNAQIREGARGEEIVYHHYCDIGIAVGGGKGLVVPVLRNAEQMSFAEIEKAIADFAQRAKENRIGLDELKGGTFTISNGGVYGSLLSTPIINPPQSGILGLHAIQDRPVARGGEVVVRKMMYVALTYDHRIVDGREAVSFLKRIKECIEEPARMLVDV